MSTTTTVPELIQRLNERLNEEKWTRTALGNYTVANLEELDEIVREIHEADLENEAREVCIDHLEHSKNSIIALYISGLLDLSRQSVNDGNLIMLTKTFTDNHKPKLVEYLANRILDFGENRFALRILADVYEEDKQDAQLQEVWERLIRVDYEEADIVRRLAEIKEAAGETESAIEYYKKALHRYINKRGFTQAKEIWNKLVQLAPSETEFFYHAEAKIARAMGGERAVQLLEDLYPYFKETEQWTRAIELLKRVLNYDSKNAWARREIVECFRSEYAEHSNLEEYIRISNVSQNWRPVHEAIADFEKHISFDTGNFVFHRTWGIGRIRTIKGDDITIDFAKKRDHSMSLKMAINALEVLPKDHIWVLRAVWKKDKLRALVKKNIVWALKTVIRSLGNAADMKKIKAELVPSILTQGEWSSWSTKARAILKTNPDFGTLTDKLDHFVVRDQPITFEEKSFNRFKAEKSFFDRVKTFEEYLAYVEGEHGEGLDGEFFREMFAYFAGYLRNPQVVNELTIASLIVVADLVERYPFLSDDLDLEFDRYYQQIEDLELAFSRIESNDLQKRFLARIRAADANWGAVYARLLPYHLSRDTLLELERSGKRRLIQGFFSRVYDNYRDMRETFVWLVRNTDEDPWFESVGINEERLLLAMVHIYDLTFRDIDNRKDVSTNRKINKQCQTYLFKEEKLASFLAEADEDSVGRLFTLISDVKDLEPKLVLDLKQTVLDRFPDFHFYGESTPAEAVVRKALLCTASQYEAKRQEYNHLQQVEVPQNSKEIEVARSYGDLRENAEYKAALERQDSLNTRAARLQQELDQAQIVKREDVDATKVGFGTKVSLTDLAADDATHYTILGPWESDPEEHIINYQSPLGGRLMRAAPGDELEFEINETKYHFRVENIEVAEFA